MATSLDRKNGDRRAVAVRPYVLNAGESQSAASLSHDARGDHRRASLATRLGHRPVVRTDRATRRRPVVVAGRLRADHADSHTVPQHMEALPQFLGEGLNG